MGLMSRRNELKKLEMKLTFLEMLKEEFGLEPKDLHFLPEALTIVKEIKEKGLNNNPKTIQPDETTAKQYKEDKDKKMTPEQFISQFAGESEEFYPYGRKSKTNNN